MGEVMAYIKAVPENVAETVVSDVFITEYMPDANGNFVKVYLLGLNQCKQERPMTIKEMADKLCMLESDIIRAWNFWADRNVVNFDGENVEFLQLIQSKKISLNETKPVYFADEIAESARTNPELAGMFQIVGKILAKPLSSNDITVLYSLYDFYGMALDVIPMLVTYCVGNGKKSMRHIEKNAGIWIDKGIDSVESAEEYLKKVEEHNKLISKLKKSIGIIDRNFSTAETKYINRWLYDMKMPFEMIMYSFELCTVNTGKFSVKYMDKVLSNWYTDGVKTLKKAKEPVVDKSNAVPTKFTNFDQRAFDYDTFDKKSTERAGNK